MTCILFVSKLRGLLLQYLDARKVNNCEVADHVKASLTEPCLKYALSVDNNLLATA